MVPSSFTLSFPQHVENAKRDQWLEWIREKGAEVELVTANIYRVTCHRSGQLQKVGWGVYHTALSEICSVLEVSGAAEAQASAYPRPES